MNIKNPTAREVFFLGFFILFITLCIPQTANAQYSRGSSAYRSKINKLDDDAVKNLPIPILFGLTLHNITPNFGDPRDGGTRTHEGLDIMAPKGALIISPTDAVVTRTGTGASSGKYVTTANPGGETFVYMHLSKILVKSGAELKEGDIIGYVGNTGNASGGAPHLHFEVRKGRRATDPYPRITRELSLKDKIDFLINAINNVSDEDELIEFVVNNYQGELQRAKIDGIELTDDVEDGLADAKTSTPPSATALGDLTLESEGPLVATLQIFLIAKDSGPSARALALAGATGYFGPITMRALMEYQSANGITPASGYFGPITRAYILTQEKGQN